MLNKLKELQVSIQDLSAERINAHEFCRVWRTQEELLGNLPPQFADVMENLLGRLEASSMFTEESCSFSQADLVAQLQIWLDKAATRLQK
ncbi:hypothetical protein [Undibacterium sp. TJN19]|uniref:hypothetical protein n=1 Tax=Undibacterium sp. TJN19 TaxID=3413055 RepID=UPI003BF235B9